jgi:MFS family permease
MALFCVQIDYFAMNLALPRMASELHSTAADLQWVISVYMLTLGAFMVPAGRIGDIFGRRRALMAGVALFGVTSVLCAIAPSAPLIVASRALQGIGAALIFPVSVSVLTNAFPAVRAGQAIGLAYGMAGLGNAAGPLIGGLLTDTVGWRWIFWLNVPLTLVSLVIGAWSISESS